MDYCKDAMLYLIAFPHKVASYVQGFFFYSKGTSQCWSTDYSYTGSMSVTKGGIQCQRWDSQYPHSHEFDEDEMYPFDGTTTAAENYCRDPDDSSIPWCFTVDIGKRWENCDIPLCDGMQYGQTHNYFYISRGSSMSAHILLNLLSELGKRDEEHFISFPQ